MISRAVVAGAFVLALCAWAAELDLEFIMRNWDWMGNGPEQPYWADDSASVYFQQKRFGERVNDLVEVNLEGRELHRWAELEPVGASSTKGEFSSGGGVKVYARYGDIYWTDVSSGRTRQLTRTVEPETEPAFLADENKVSFLRGETIFVRDLRSGLEYQLADIRSEEDPDKKKEDFDFVREQQKRLFDAVRESKEAEEKAKTLAREQQARDKSRSPLPIYLGKDLEILDTVIGPREDYLLVRVINTKDRKKASKEQMPNYVTETGRTASRDAREYVGDEQSPTEQLMLVDLATREVHALDMSLLPGITEDPLKELREAAMKARGEEIKEEKEPKPRKVYFRSVQFSRDGRRAVFQAHAHDYKDRWITSVDLSTKSVKPLFRESNAAWVLEGQWLGFLGRGDRVYFVSEATGYCQLYVIDPEGGEARQLTSGKQVVSSTVPTRDGRYVYFLANPRHPGVYEVFRARVEDGGVEQVTSMGGREEDLLGSVRSFQLSPDERRILIGFSTTTHPIELYVQRAQPGAEARRITHTVSAEFEGIAWTKPEIVEIASTKVDRPIYSRYYARSAAASSGKSPAVVFMHGAGYLQDAHAGWSSYFREFMFHTLLTQRGVAVLDMDYRGSAGYGADWRAAIYRQMGGPEIKDLQDGVRWLTEEHGVDPARIGIYGGSYGGFLTLMALFRDPERFACGAALRPVLDWSHYNHGYTANILNTPSVDPEAYVRSSPIEFAAGLSKPLLFCHGMQDDNVLFQDSVRLAQRLIELKKENWEFAVYPVEPHGFREPESWLDEYRRILKLFEANLELAK